MVTFPIVIEKALRDQWMQGQHLCCLEPHLKPLLLVRRHSWHPQGLALQNREGNPPPAPTVIAAGKLNRTVIHCLEINPAQSIYPAFSLFSSCVAWAGLINFLQQKAPTTVAWWPYWVSLQGNSVSWMSRSPWADRSRRSDIRHLRDGSSRRSLWRRLTQACTQTQS